jgi:hypothetical protein
VFVVGCHRSGTSLLASLFVDALGQAGRADLEPAIDNPRGFCESRKLVEFNDRLLALAGADWCHPPLLPPRWTDPKFFNFIQQERPAFTSYSLSSAWIDKDPRLSITFPAVQHLLLRRVAVIVALRSPLDVAISLHLRNGFHLEAGLGLWFLYNHHLSRHLQSQDQVIPYRLILAATEAHDSSLLTGLLQSFLKTNANVDIPQRRWREIFASRIDPALSRASTVNHDVSHVSHELLLTLNDAYNAACHGVDGFREAFSSLPVSVLDLFNHHGILASPGLLDLQHENQHLCARLDALHRSRSWRFTAPFRWLTSRCG